MKASEVRMGHEIEVDLGKGKVFRPVDHVQQHENGTVTITLYSPFGVRPKITVNNETEVKERTA